MQHCFCATKICQKLYIFKKIFAIILLKKLGNFKKFSSLKYTTFFELFFHLKIFENNLVKEFNENKFFSSPHSMQQIFW